jgi:hypothetical protein
LLAVETDIRQQPGVEPRESPSLPLSLRPTVRGGNKPLAGPFCLGPKPRVSVPSVIGHRMHVALQVKILFALPINLVIRIDG